MIHRSTTAHHHRSTQPHHQAPNSPAPSNGCSGPTGPTPSLPQALINQFNYVAAQLQPTTNPGTLFDLTTITTQMAFNAFNNAPCGGFIGPLYDISSETVHGPQTTNPPDVQAIGQLTNYILVREPDWAPLLWINWDGATTLTVQVRDLLHAGHVDHGVAMVDQLASVPHDAADDIIGAIYLMQLTTPKFGASSDNITISDFGLTATRTTQTFTVTPPAGCAAANRALHAVKDRPGLLRSPNAPPEPWQTMELSIPASE